MIIPPQHSAARKLLRLHSLRQGRSAEGDSFLRTRHSERRAPEMARGKRRDGRCARAAAEEEYSVEVRGSHLMREAIRGHLWLEVAISHLEASKVSRDEGGNQRRSVAASGSHRQPSADSGD